MRNLFFSVALFGAVWFAGLSATTARADLVIQGRDAQALHCAAMTFMVTELVFRAGRITLRDKAIAQTAALIYLQKVPGTEKQRSRAMQQRFVQITSSRSVDELFKEWSKSRNWCLREFLKP